METVNMTTKLDYPIPHKIHMLAHKLQLEAEQILSSELNISFNGYVFLHILECKGEKPQDELAKFAGITPAAASKRIQALVEKGFVKVEVNPENRRQHITTITAKGKKVQQKGTKALEASFKEKYGNMKSMQQFEKTLDQMLELYLGEC